MFTYQRDAAQVAQFANQYNFDELVACLTDYLDPKAAAKHLKLIYFTLTEYILSDTENMGVRMSRKLWLLCGGCTKR